MFSFTRAICMTIQLELSTEVHRGHQWYTTYVQWLLFFINLSAINSSAVRAKVFWVCPPSMADCWGTHSCADLMQAPVAAVSMWLQWLCLTQKMIFHTCLSTSYILPTSYTFFSCLLFCNVPLALEGMIQMSCSRLSTHPCLMHRTLCSFMSALTTVHGKERLLRERLRVRAVYHEYKYKEGSLCLCQKQSFENIIFQGLIIPSQQCFEI